MWPQPSRTGSHCRLGPLMARNKTCRSIFTQKTNKHIRRLVMQKKKERSCCTCKIFITDHRRMVARWRSHSPVFFSRTCPCGPCARRERICAALCTICRRFFICWPHLASSSMFSPPAMLFLLIRFLQLHIYSLNTESGASVPYLSICSGGVGCNGDAATWCRDDASARPCVSIVDGRQSASGAEDVFG